MLATQNPIEQEGTYPLPEAQQDRFMFNMLVDYPSEEEELQDRRDDHGRRHRRRSSATLSGDGDPGLAGHRPQGAGGRSCDPLRHEVHAADAGAKRAKFPTSSSDYVSWGAGPRASQFLVLGAKARAVLHGRYYANCEDIRAVAAPVLRHRIITNFNAEAEGIKPDEIVQRLIETIPADEDEPLPVESYQKYLNPQTLASLQGLELRARLIVEGYVSGVHRSPYHGFSIEFAEHREYVPGDDLRYVDWKVFGKTDKIYLKQYEEETNLVSYMLLDTSESMRYKSDGAPMSSWNMPNAAPRRWPT